MEKKRIIKIIEHTLWNLVNGFALCFKIVMGMVILSYLSINYDFTNTNSELFLSIIFFGYLIYTFAIHIMQWKYEKYKKK